MTFVWKNQPSKKRFKEIIITLLQWYDLNQRELPWRANSYNFVTPFHVLVSEVMLQQTTVKTVIPYFTKFINRFKTPYDLALCSQDELFWYWQGLGYYRRATNLQKCAKILKEKDLFPETSKELITLPGVGFYTAAAVAAICFNETVLPVDGNIARVLSRLFEFDDMLPELKKKLMKHNAVFHPPLRPGDSAQAFMDLGATICTPTSPKCEVCPLSAQCGSFKHNTCEKFPVLEEKKRKPTRYGTVYFIEKEGKVLVQKRLEKGLLHGLMEFPSTPWLEGVTELFNKDAKHIIKHTFTHFHLSLSLEKKPGEFSLKYPDAMWVRLEDIHALAFPTLMKKVLKAGIS